ncbi:MAG: amidase [Chloroflexi bacterium]|nr:MAG: amidase [Chloroflexota bacterium]TMG30680.1 MAG: amidase [Chloroflexota bacterium]
MGEITDSELSRRDVLKLGAGAVAGAAALSVVRSLPAAAAPTNLNEMTVAQMQASMASHQLSSLDLVNYYLTRIKTIDQAGPTVNSVIEVNPDATAIAQSLDAERKAGHVRGPLHGIPVLLKDNVDTGDKMQTAAGSLGLVGTPAAHDSAVAANLRAAGAVILGKTTLSEWANFRSFFSTSGWSGRGGQCNNPYALDRNACGSSSGSGAAASANFTAVSIGSETDGSIVCPASMNGVVGIKPTVGLTSRGGVVPISHTQDTVGPHCRTVADAAAVLSAIAQRTPDSRDPATSANRDKIPADYTTFLNPHGLNGARIGVARDFEGFSPHADAVFEDSLTAMSNAGATLVDVFFPHISDINSGIAEFTVLLFDFKGDLQKYFATRTGVPLAGGTLQTAIDFDNANAAKEMPFFAQEIFDLAETFDITSTSVVQPLGMSYDQAIAFDKLIGATEGIDKLLTDNNLDAIVAPTDSPAFPTDLINADHFIFGSSSPAAIVGYPIINVPMGMTFGVPVGISFMGTAFSEPKLITLASGFEAVTHARRQPTFLATLPFNTKGEPTRVKQRRVMPGRVAPSHI